jgi:RNA polymerase sigma-70 factor (ECF subfamily)
VTPDERERIERDARDACARGDLATAATTALRAYGPEVFGLLVGLLRDPDDAADVFAGVTESFWKSLPTFAWACSLRTWMYTLARNGAHHFKRDEGRRERRSPRAGESALDEIAERVRTETLTFLRTEKKTRLQEIRESLDPDDQLLLVLRIDRGFAWNELARVMAEGEDEAKAAARLRKRFQLLKEKLVAIAKREGLLEDK